MFLMKMVGLLFILLCGSVFGQYDRKLGSIGAEYPTVGDQFLYKYSVQAYKTPFETEYESNIKDIVTAAADFLLDKRQADYGWSSPVSTSRAIVALAFAEKARRLPKSEWQLMKKQLNIQLSLDLLAKPMKTSLSHLALYINALYATCQEPRSFQGLDLVSRLGSETRRAMSTKFNLPIVLLTLCVAGESDPDSRFEQIRNIYDFKNETSTRSLTLIALDCMRKRDGRFRREFDNRLKEHILQTDNLTDGNLDVYSTALYFQASNQATFFGRDATMLLRHLKPDGSFGDLLSTYYAIPALLNSTLLDLRCNGAVMKDAWTENAFNMHAAGKNITYSLWIPTDTYVNTRTITVNYGEGATFYDVMLMAEFKDPTYTFMYDIINNDEVKDVVKIYSLADTPNDPETGKSWTLFKTNKETVVNSQKNLQRMSWGVNTFKPDNGAHYIFWLKRDEFLRTV